MLDRCGEGSGEYAGESEEKAEKFSVYCRCDVLERIGEVSKELEVAISALSGIGSCWVRRMR